MPTRSTRAETRIDWTQAVASGPRPLPRAVAVSRRLVRACRRRPRQNLAHDQGRRRGRARPRARRQADDRLRRRRRAARRTAARRRQPMPAEEFLRGTPIARGSVLRLSAAMPRYKLTIEYDGTPFVGWQVQDNGPSVQGVLTDAIAAFAGERVAVARRRTHRCRRARARPGRACRSRQGLGRRHRARRDQFPSAPAADRRARGGAGRDGFRRALLGDQAPLSLSHRQSPRRPRARAEPRLARAAPARLRRDARGRAETRRQARLHDLPRRPSARPNRR